MKITFTDEMVFSFDRPNLCLVGNENDFRKLAEAILDLTDVSKPYSIELSSLDFMEYDGEEKRILFLSKSGSKKLGILNEVGELIFELDPRYWERLFKYFVLMSWYKRTYYLNEYENCLDDLLLEQECNFICSSGF
jgi:hypothetical protein